MLSITYDPIKDVTNWLRIKRTYPKEFQFTKEYPFDQNISFIEKNIAQIASTLPGDTKKELENIAHRLSVTWKNEERRAVKVINQYLSTDIRIFSAKANLTTAYKMPYDHRHWWFMIQANKPLPWQIRNIVHELFHLFHLQCDPSATKEILESTVEIFLKKHYPLSA